MAGAQGAQFGVSEVEVVSATVDLDEVVSFRGGIASLQQQARSHAAHLLSVLRLRCLAANPSLVLDMQTWRWLHCTAQVQCALQAG